MNKKRSPKQAFKDKEKEFYGHVGGAKKHVTISESEPVIAPVQTPVVAATPAVPVQTAPVTVVPK